MVSGKNQVLIYTAVAATISIFVRTQSHPNGITTQICYRDCRSRTARQPGFTRESSGTSGSPNLLRFRREYPKLSVLGDALMAHAPMVQLLREQRMDFLLMAKEGNCMHLQQFSV